MYTVLFVALGVNKGSKVMSLKEKLNKDSAIDFWHGIDNLLLGIKKDYAKWTTSKEGIDSFNKGLDIKMGRKFTKIMNGTSVWGFVANGDGVLKGIPYFKGDVFKAASWRGPAKHVRGSIFSGKTDWFRWTVPAYLI